MAAPCTDDNNSLRIDLKGKISRDIRSEIVKDIIKFLLYHRQQIPLPYIQLRKVVKDLAESHPSTKQAGKTEKVKFIGSSCHKKLDQLFEAVDDILQNVGELFESHPDVTRLLVILGATIVSPKETYEILLEQSSSIPLAEVKSVKHCQRILNRSLITCDTLADLLPPATSMHLLIEGRRTLNTAYFKPKLNFKIPKRGQYFTFRINSGYNNGLSQSLSSENSEHSISSEDIDEKDYVWYIAPRVVKGIKADVLPFVSKGDSWVS